MSRTPELDERRVLPRRWLGALDPRVDRQQGGSRHAVLESGPRGAAKRPTSGWEPLVERADVSPERQDLRAGEGESSVHDRRLYRCAAAGTRGDEELERRGYRDDLVLLRWVAFRRHRHRTAVGQVGVVREDVERDRDLLSRLQRERPGVVFELIIDVLGVDPDRDLELPDQHLQDLEVLVAGTTVQRVRVRFGAVVLERDPEADPAAVVEPMMDLLMAARRVVDVLADPRMRQPIDQASDVDAAQ